MTKRMHQQTKKVPTDGDEILRRAKVIKARERRELQVRRARDVIIKNNAKKEREKRNAMYEKHGYVEGNKRIKGMASKISKLAGLRRLLDR